MDSFENDLASMGVRRRASAISSVSQALDPDLWRTLPLELLHLVYAHLPLVDIVRLRVLSTTWNRYVSGDMLGFTKVCAEVNPRLFGMIGSRAGIHDVDGLMAVMLPGSGSSWHKYFCTSSEKGYDYTMRSGDGGLVCSVSFSQFTCQHPRIVVRNPLTWWDRTLPRLPYYMRSPRLLMVQLVMDRDLKCYRVLGWTPGMQARVFCSVAGKWRSAEASDGLVFGFRYGWEYSIDGDFDCAYIISRLPCVHDCASGKLVDLDYEGSPWEAAGLLLPVFGFSLNNNPLTFALVKDWLFVLHKGLVQRWRDDLVRGGFDGGVWSMSRRYFRINTPT